MVRDLVSEIVGAFALMFIFQGIQLSLWPARIRALWLQLFSLDDRSLQAVGCVIGLGLLLAWCVWS